MKNQLVLQDIILNYVRREKISVMITLSSNEKIEGVIHGFDSQTIIINQGEHQILLYKANILSVYSPVIVLNDKQLEKET